MSQLLKLATKIILKENLKTAIKNLKHTVIENGQIVDYYKKVHDVEVGGMEVTGQYCEYGFNNTDKGYQFICDDMKSNYKTILNKVEQQYSSITVKNSLRDKGFYLKSEKVQPRTISLQFVKDKVEVNVEIPLGKPLTIETKGVKGKGCTKITEGLEKILGDVLQMNHTSEAYEQDCNIVRLNQVKNSTLC